MEKPRTDAESVLGTQGICSDQTLNYKKGKTAKIEKKNTKPVGTGPYVLKSYDKFIGASSEKNSYFKAEKGTVDYIPDVTDADKISSIIQSKNKDLTLDSYNGDRTNWLYLNTADGPCKDQAFRQALAYGIDRQAYIDSYYKLDESDEVMAYVPSSFGNLISKTCGSIVTRKEKLDGLNTYEYSPEKAEQLLDDAGWKVGSDGIREKDGERLSIRFLSIKEKDNMDSMIPILQKDWQEIEIELKANTMEFNTNNSTISDDNTLGDWDAGWIDFSNGSPKDTGMNDLLKSKAVDNFPRLSDLQLDADLDAGTYTSNSEQSAQVFKQAMIV